MNITRREFIERTGIALAALAMARCGAGSSQQPSPTPTTRDRLRGYWLQFSLLAQQTRDSWDSQDMGEDALNQLVQNHRSVLNELVAGGELSAAVADDIHTAYAAAAYHVWRSNVPVTCYEPVLIDYKPTSAAQLVQQAAVLAEMAESADLDPAAVAKARAVVERDIAFLILSSQKVQAMYEALLEAGGESFSIPNFDQLELEAPPEAIEAARFLTDLLLGEQSQ